MRILARTLNNTVLQLSLSISAYVYGPLSNVSNQDPVELLEAHLPYDFIHFSDHKLADALELACLSALRSEQEETAYLAPLQILLDPQDLQDFKSLHYQNENHPA